MSRRLLLDLLTASLLFFGPRVGGEELRKISEEELRDKIRGGWAGQMVGNIQGLPFEFKYKDAPGPLPEFKPNLPRCPSDDDTDIEWVHLHAMDRLGTLEVPYPDLAREWVRSINRKIWVSNERARNLMETGIVPPWTSHPALNPHAGYNLSGQFCVEAYGLVSPGLPVAASRLGAHYARVTVRGEPIQACAYWTSMIALAFFEIDIETLATRSLEAVDPKSQHAEMVRDLLKWHSQSPGDWSVTRAKVQQKYRDERGWNMNATVTNGAFVLAALLYGRGDFVRTMQLAFALGYDADCNAATCGAILGALYGARALESRYGAVLPAFYDNRTRDGMPETESMDDLVALTARLAEKVILQEGGSRAERAGGVEYKVPMQQPAALGPVRQARGEEKSGQLKKKLREEAFENLSANNPAARVFAALYLAHEQADDERRLEEREKEKVRGALEAAREDPVLRGPAERALAKLDLEA